MMKITRMASEVFGCMLMIPAMLFAAEDASMRPTTLPEAPADAADQVLSIYCGYYTDAVSFTPSADLTEVEVTVGEKTEKMYHGQVGPNGGSCYFDFGEQGVDLSAYNSLFLDVYMCEANATEFKFRLNGNNGTDIKVQLKQGWNRLQIDLNDYGVMKSAPNLKAVKTMNFVGGGYDRNLYIDNLYASMAMDAYVAQIAAFPAPVPVHHEQDNSVLAIFSDYYSTQVGTNVNFSQVVSGVETAIRVKGVKYEGSDEVDAAVFYMNMKGGTNATTFVAPVDIVAYDSIHFDVFPLSGDVRMRLSLGKSTLWDSFQRTATKGQWNSFDIAISDYLAGLKEADRTSIDLTAISKFTIFDYGGGARTFFLDNIYFYKKAEDPTSIAHAAGDGLRIETAGETLIVRADAPACVDVYAVDGRLVRRLEVAAGANRVTLPKGVYVVAGQKVVLF